MYHRNQRKNLYFFQKKPFRTLTQTESHFKVIDTSKYRHKRTQVVKARLQDQPTVDVGTQYKLVTDTGARNSKNAHRDKGKGRKAEEISSYECWLHSKSSYF